MTRNTLPETDPKRNLLLAALEPADYEALMREAKIVSLKMGKRLLRQDANVDAVYFPLTCMVSLLAASNGESQVEMAILGKEGAVGAAEAINAQGAMGVNLIQLPGAAVRIEGEAFRRLMVASPSALTLMNQHLYALMRQILYGAACNQLHTMEERCARWLLMTHDRAGQDTFPLTQEFLASMLAVRRATVNVATGMLKKAGFIQYVRGKITIIDRSGLESASCECYRAIVKVYDQLFSKAVNRAS